MTDNSKKEKHREPQEEFIDEGLVQSHNAGETNREKSEYNDWTLEELHREASRKGVKNFKKLSKSELINRLNTIQS